MRSRRSQSPLWRDVVQGTVSGVAAGRFVIRDATESTEYADRLMDEDYVPLTTSTGEWLLA